jgi:mRNA deadenylase 3'-5' endonuclease subunit Ccr4
MPTPFLRCPAPNVWVCAEHLKWELRCKALMEVVRELDADILCLQEVDKYEGFWVKELAYLGYTGEITRRSWWGW